MGALELSSARSEEATNMLVNQEHSDVFPLLGEVLERPFDLRGLGFGINDKEVSLGVRWFGDML
jgi:hypothetical protein